jgi:hypothetical protein
MKIYNIDIPYKNTYELVKSFLNIYTTSMSDIDENLKLRPKLIEVLSYYILYGYSDETKEMIIDSVDNMNILNLNQINSELQRKKYLVKDRYKNSLRHLSDSLNSLRLYLNDKSDKKVLLISYSKKNENTKHI